MIALVMEYVKIKFVIANWNGKRKTVPIRIVLHAWTKENAIMPQVLVTAKQDGDKLIVP